MKLIIAEKPSVAMNIAKVVGANKRENGYSQGDEYLVSWCVGHLVALAIPDAYDSKYKQRNIEDLPIFPKQWKYIVEPATAAQFNILKGLMARKDVDSLICATDAGREGEHIFRLVYQQSGCKKPFERLWISSMEESAIRDGMKNLADSHDYDNLAAAADCRSKADWLVGMNASRLFQSAVGRVQTPTLALVVSRVEQIEQFKPSYSYIIRLKMDGVIASSDKFPDAESANKVLQLVQVQDAIVTKVMKKEQKSSPPKLYDLTTLQRDANRLFALSAKETLSIAQSLYEKKLLTYPRTDSSFLTKDLEGSTNVLISVLSGHTAFPFAVLAESPDLKRVVNSSKVSDHHAILPTSGVAHADMSALSHNEQLVLSLVVSRLFMAVAPPEVSQKIEVEMDCAGTIFKAIGKNTISSGWKALLTAFRASLKHTQEDSDETEPEEAALPDVMEGHVFSVVAQMDKVTTSPPSHYTDDTLLSAMERAGNSEYDDLDIEKRGLGTPATMADTIEGLIRRGYLERVKKRLIPTQNGRNLIKLLPLTLTSPKMTVEWETKLQQMAQGKGNPDSFMQEVLAFICTLIAEFDVMTPEQKALIPKPKGRESLGSCPRCRSEVYEGKSGYYCSAGIEKCGFFVKKEPLFFVNAKKKLTKTMMKDFLAKGKVNVKGLYSAKKDSTYDAVVVMEDTGKWVNFKPVFESKVKE